MAVSKNERKLGCDKTFSGNPAPSHSSTSFRLKLSSTCEPLGTRIDWRGFLSNKASEWFFPSKWSGTWLVLLQVKLLLHTLQNTFAPDRIFRHLASKTWCLIVSSLLFCAGIYLSKGIENGQAPTSSCNVNHEICSREICSRVLCSWSVSMNAVSIDWTMRVVWRTL